MRILLTNDDGIDGPGLHSLARALKTCGHDIVIAAPNRDYSGFGSAIGPLHITGAVVHERRELAPLPGVEAYAVDGPPGLSAFTGALGGFGGIPDLVVSGINAGANLGRAVLFSGTVGAALAASQFGVPAMAISIVTGDETHYDTAAVCAASLVHSAHANGTGSVLNVNVPNLRPYAIKGMHAARLAIGGQVQVAFDASEEGTLKPNYQRNGDPPEGTDVALVYDGWITLSMITSVRDANDASLDAIVSQLTKHELAG